MLGTPIFPLALSQRLRLLNRDALTPVVRDIATASP
jgi:hypothetical protein